MGKRNKFGNPWHIDGILSMTLGEIIEEARDREGRRAKHRALDFSSISGQGGARKLVK